MDDNGRPVAEIDAFFEDFVARGNSVGSVRSYAYDLRRWWRWLVVVGVRWDRATSSEVRDFVLWMMSTTKEGGAKSPSPPGRSGTVNAVTRKRYLDDHYQPRTVRHSNAVLRTFYEYWIDVGLGPLRNPVIRESMAGRRAHAHHRPLEPFQPGGRLRYNPAVPTRKLRAMPEDRWVEFFARMRSHRDRAIVAIAVSNGARAGEILGMRGEDVDWGQQLVRVRRKGTCAEQWLPGSSQAFVWLRLYLADVGSPPADGPIWVTLRQRTGSDGPYRSPLSYDALRAVFARANQALGSNWTMHDLRHTAALRMAHDEHLSLRDVQVILGHAHVTTTQIYLNEDDEAVIDRVHRHLSEQAAKPPSPPRPALGYDPATLEVLFGSSR